MPRYIGERRGEMYYRRNGKWHHCRDNGREFDSLEDAQKDFDTNFPSWNFTDDLLGLLFAFLMTMLAVKLFGGMLCHIQ